MYGHGAAPPPRSAATVISLRVLFTAAGLLTCGVLSCVPLFRVAILRGRVLDWAAAWVSLPLSIACFAVVGTLPEGDYRTDIALAVVLLLGAAASIYFLVVDISFHSEQRQAVGYAPSPAHNTPTPYGYPQPASPYGPMAVPQPPQTPQSPTPRPPQSPGPFAPPTPIPQPPGSATPVPQPPAPHDAAPPPAPVPPPPSPQRPAPARIDQVRAELDELSDYLRRHESEGHREGHHGGHDHDGDHDSDNEGGR